MASKKDIVSRERFVYGLFCEQVRAESSGQHNYIGVFTNTVYTSRSFPLVLPSLCLIVGFIIPVDEEIGETSINIVLPGGEILDGGAIPAPPSSSPIGDTNLKKLVLIVRLNNINLKEAGQVIAYVTNNKVKWCIASMSMAIRSSKAKTQEISTAELAAKKKRLKRL